MSKVSLPNSTILNFYYYFTTFSLISTCMLAPFVFYIILTQSKNMKEFKWFLLNQLLWGFLLEIGIGIFKPVAILPAVAFYSNISTSPYMTIVAISVFTSCIFLCGTGMFLSIGNRNLTMFPSFMTKFFTTKNAVIFGLVLSFIEFAPTIFLINRFISSGLNDSLKSAIEYDPFFKDFNEPSLLFMAEEYWKPYIKYVCICCIVIIILGLPLIFYFFFLIRKNLTMTVIKLQRTLIISVTIQLLLYCIFYLFPFAIIIACALLEAPNSSYISCLMFSFISCHSFVDFSIILLFITPYRNFILEKLKKLLGYKKNSRARVSVIATTEYQPKIRVSIL